MEFLSGYAAARAPLSAYQVEPSARGSKQPARSNSTSAGSSSSSKKRSSRVHARGHVRTSSTASTASSHRTDRTETPSSPHPFASSSWYPPGSAVSEGGGTDSATTPLLSAEPSALRRRDPPLQPRKRMPAAVAAAAASSAGNKYYHKQLPATPRLETHSAAAYNQQFFAAAVSSSEPGSARTPASATAEHPSSATFSHDRRPPQHAAMFPELGGSAKAYTYTSNPPLYPSGRAESVSSISAITAVSTRSMLSSEPPSSAEVAEQQRRPFVVRNGRTFISDQTLPYPLPVDLEELHRQSLRTLLLMQLFGGPICSPDFADKPPKRVLEIGCGSGFWSMMCFRYYERQGLHRNISFTGVDIAPVAPGAPHQGSSTTGASANDGSSADLASDGVPEEMKWRFVQHDLRRQPLPFRDEEFDLVMVKDMSLGTTISMQQLLMDEYLRVLQPGGTIEIWEGDHTLRMLRPHVPEAPSTTLSQPTNAAGGDDETSSPTSSTDEEHAVSQSMQTGAYPMTANTPLSAPLNNFLVEYNSWLSKALERLQLCPVPCTLIGPMLAQEAEILTAMGNKRLAVPLSEVRWEREGVGGVVTKDGKSYIETKGKKSREAAAGEKAGSVLEPGAAALRRTALLTVVGMVQSLEHVLREVSGKSQDEWDGWLGKMMGNLVRENGTSWGECLEVGAWWARKKGKK